ncbi:hypothetical protein ACOMHN_051012 [Nucella lapillus]
MTSVWHIAMRPGLAAGGQTRPPLSACWIGVLTMATAPRATCHANTLCVLSRWTRPAHGASLRSLVAGGADLRPLAGQGVTRGWCEQLADWCEIVFYSNV